MTISKAERLQSRLASVDVLSLASPDVTETNVAHALSGMKICVSAPVRMLDGKRQGLTSLCNPLIEYLVSRTKKLYVIDHPWVSDPDRTPIMEEYSEGKLHHMEELGLPRVIARNERLGSKMPFYYLMKFIDFASSVVLVLRKREVVDLFIGVESINALAGLLLKRLGRVRHLVYFCCDFQLSSIRSRFGQTSTLQMDRVSCEHADMVWDDAKNTEQLREGIWGKSGRAPEMWAPTFGLEPSRSSFIKRVGHAFVYLGINSPRMGVQIVISAMPSILQRVADAHLHVIGPDDGDSERRLKELAARLGVARNISFHGYLSDSEVERILVECKLGVAPYTVEVASLPEFRFADSSKARYYAAHGLPVVFSKSIAWFAEVVERFGAGVAVNPAPGPIGDAVCRLMLDQPFYDRCFRGTQLLAEAFSSSKLYNDVFSHSLAYLRGEKIDRYDPWFADLMEKYVNTAGEESSGPFSIDK